MGTNHDAADMNEWLQPNPLQPCFLAAYSVPSRNLMDRSGTRSPKKQLGVLQFMDEEVRNTTIHVNYAAKYLSLGTQGTVPRYRRSNEKLGAGDKSSGRGGESGDEPSRGAALDT